MTSCRLLEVQKAENGNKWPETIAVVLWGTDNIKTYGESLAQVRHRGPCHLIWRGQCPEPVQLYVAAPVCSDCILFQARVMAFPLF